MTKKVLRVALLLCDTPLPAVVEEFGPTCELFGSSNLF